MFWSKLIIHQKALYDIFYEKVVKWCMIKTVLKIDGMMCGMCESHMNDVVRKSCSPKKVNSSAKNGETVVIIEAPLDIPYLKQQIKDIGYELVSYTSEPYEKKGFFHFGR